MTINRIILLSILPLVLSFAGCSSSGSGSGDDGSDGGNTDSGTTDSSTTDGGSTDSGTTGTGNTDDGGTGTGTTDSSTTDGGSTGTGTTDSGTTDGGSTGTGTTDSGTTDAGTTDGGSTGGASGDDTSAIAGLWDFTDSFEGEEDVFYIQVTSNGLGIDWDYQGDSFDQGDNCYFRESYSIGSLGNNRYVIDEEELTISVINGDLHVVYPDEGDGEYTLVWPPLTGVSPTDFNVCRGSVNNKKRR